MTNNERMVRSVGRETRANKNDKEAADTGEKRNGGFKCFIGGFSCFTVPAVSLCLKTQPRLISQRAQSLSHASTLQRPHLPAWRLPAT
jgi:hypothetical protein